MTNKAIHYLIILAVCMIGVSCNNEEEVIPQGKYENGALISNEGNFSDVDGSVGFYDIQNAESNSKVFENENGRPFGGLLQSIGLHDNFAYLIDNLGSKIEVVDANSFESITTIMEGQSLPRYFAAEGGRGFVSNWGPYAQDFSSPDSFLSIIDTENNLPGENIEVPSRPEGMIISDGKLFLSSQATNIISIVDINTLEITGSIEVGFGPSHFQKDRNGNLWVTCLDGQLISFDPGTNMILQEVQIGDLVGKFAIDKAGETIYLLTSTWAPDYSFTENAVIKLDISSPQTQTSIFTSRNLYGIGIDPVTDIIYLANSNAFQGNGTIIRIDSKGKEIDNFPAGRGPNGFVFR